MWSVLAIEEDDGTCQVLDLLKEGLERGDRDAREMLAQLSRVADEGPSPNKQKCRPLRSLSPYILEFKSGLLRVFWFYEGKKVIVCAEALKKAKQKELKRQVKRAETLRERLLAAGGADKVEIAD